MTKEKIIQAIRNEIERLKGIEGIVPLDNREQKTGYESALIDIGIFLDSLEETKYKVSNPIFDKCVANVDQKVREEVERNVGLAEEIQRFLSNATKMNKGEWKGKYPISEFGFGVVARHFAEWQKEQMMKDAEECELYWYGDFLVIDLNMAALGYYESDKVKIIIVKEDEQC